MDWPFVPCSTALRRLPTTVPFPQPKHSNDLRCTVGRRGGASRRVDVRLVLYLMLVCHEVLVMRVESCSHDPSVLVASAPRGLYRMVDLGCAPVTPPYTAPCARQPRCATAGDPALLEPRARAPSSTEVQGFKCVRDRSSE